MTKIITDSNYQEVFEQSLPIVIDFSATWCGPCKKIAPVIEELSEEYAGKVLLCKADVDDAEELAMKYGIRNVPTVIFIKNGEIVDKNVGASPKNVFVEKIENLLA